MSMSCEISFKTVKPDEVYRFFQQFKNETNKHLCEIAYDCGLNCPSRYYSEYDRLPLKIKRDLDRHWAFRVFTYRYLYVPEHNLLGIFGIDDSVKSIFDCTIYFQDSCDQDYEFDEWKGVPIFEKISNKWKNASKDTVKAKYKEIFQDEWGGNEDSEDDFEYYRRTFIYKEIWNMFESYFENDDKIVEISLYTDFESPIMSAFVRLCENYAKEKDEEIKNFIKYVEEK